MRRLGMAKKKANKKVVNKKVIRVLGAVEMVEEEKVKEKTIEREILDYLRKKKVFCFKINTMGVWDEKIKAYRKSPDVLAGTSDILGIYKKKFLAIEVKVPGKKPTELQRAFITKVIDEGGVGFAADSVEKVQTVLDYFDKNKAVVRY